jgi:hypothetical protein
MRTLSQDLVKQEVAVDWNHMLSIRVKDIDIFSQTPILKVEDVAANERTVVHKVKIARHRIHTPIQRSCNW